MVVYPKAKINIGLNILRKRSDGFHDIESVFYPIGLADTMKIKAERGQNEISLEVLGMPISGNLEDNLCVQAYRKISQHIDLTQVKVVLDKIIPMGAGLGGGSSDCASMINGLNEMFELGLSYETRIEIALELGSDCPFFIENKPKYVKGRGELLESINLNLSAFIIVIVNPGIHISTKEAYAGVTPAESNYHLLDVLSNEQVDKWPGKVINQFESHLLLKYPVIDEIKQNLYNRGALFASMTGSGSTVYGIFEKEIDLNEMADYFTWQGPLTYL